MYARFMGVDGWFGCGGIWIADGRESTDSLKDDIPGRYAKEYLAILQELDQRKYWRKRV